MTALSTSSTEHRAADAGTARLHYNVDRSRRTPALPNAGGVNRKRIKVGLISRSFARCRHRHRGAPSSPAVVQIRLAALNERRVADGAAIRRTRWAVDRFDILLRAPSASSMCGCAVEHAVLWQPRPMRTPFILHIPTSLRFNVVVFPGQIS